MAIDGYTGKILRVDLTSRKSSVEPLPERWRADYLGGTGLACRILLDNLARRLRPFDPESEIVFMTGPLAGTLVPTSSRMAVAARSPATGRAACEVVACGAAAELKFAGYDGIIVGGRASTPTFVYVADQRVTFERASRLWGKGTHETQKSIQEKKWTHMARTLAIGPAGENLVCHACVTASGHGQLGDSGIGAVMGSKNLKAVAVRGQAGVRVADMEGLLRHVRGVWGDGSRGDWRMWSDALACPAVSQDAGPPPSVHPSTGQPRRVGHSASLAIRTRLMSIKVCVFCPLGRSMSDTNAKGAAAKRAGYCTAGTLQRSQDAFGADELVRLAGLCDDLGFDTVSAAAAIGFSIGDEREGALDSGPFLADDETIATTVGLSAHGAGVGADEAEPIRRGELPRGGPGGGSHPGDGTGRLQDAAVRDSLILCSLWHPPLETIAELLTLTTGVPSTLDALREVGNRISKLRQLAADSVVVQEGKDGNAV